jgi:hypothetical protein
MMSRVQRIEYEILDCALNRATHNEGYSTTANMFLARLKELFPTIATREIQQACETLTRQSAIAISFPNIGGYRHYQGADDAAALVDAKTLRFSAASLSQSYFHQLSALIEAPAGFKPTFRLRR